MKLLFMGFGMGAKQPISMVYEIFVILIDYEFPQALGHVEQPVVSFTKEVNTRLFKHPLGV